MRNDDKDAERPDPQFLLDKIHKEHQGKLTIFLGAAAGVGKTYHMLEAAHERLREKEDVVIGWIETHGRQDTERLVAGLPRVEPKLLEYRSRKLAEMDVEAIIRRKPGLVLVDELAHTNIPGSCHVRRFQDVEELLKAGINVYTTLNIQHVESLNDVVAQITGINVRETVPDSILEQAYSVQLIDIPPDELIKRLKEGKVYVAGQAERALKNFFRPGNINALRELVLRYTARHVDQDMREYMRDHGINGPWPAAERVMVCVSGSPFSAQLIRAARRLATGLRAEWLAVHIEVVSSHFPIGEKEKERIAKNMRLAEDLGAQTFTIAGSNLAEDVMKVAHANNVTAIVIGKPRHSWIQGLFHGPTVEKIIRHSGGINVYVIQAKAENSKSITGKTVAVAPAFPWKQYTGSLILSGLVTGLSWLFQDQFELVNTALLYLLPVMFSAVWWGQGPSYFAAIVSVLSYDFLFVPPIFTFTVNDIRFVWSFIIFIIVAFFIGRQTKRLRVEAQLAQTREQITRSLYDFSREIAAVTDINVIVEGLANKAATTIGRAIVVLMPDTFGKLVVKTAKSPAIPSDHLLSLKDDKMGWGSAEEAVAAWVYENGEIAGRSTDTLPGANYLYIPLITQNKTVGVLGVQLVEKHITSEQRRLIEAWSRLAAVAAERAQLAEQAQKNELLVESERLRSALFNSISHELKTPLSSIIGASTTLYDDENIYSPVQRRDLLASIIDGANRMERLIANLLDTARIESGMLKLKIDWCDIGDILGTALRRIGESLQNHPLEINLPEDLPLLRGDCVLLEQVMVNIIDNAIKFSAQGSKISIGARVDNNMLRVSVADNGMGIPTQDLDKIFDKFYRVQQPQKISGTGLGLSICKGIIEAHGGTIWAENRLQVGTIISFKIPIHQ